jgi:DNA-binding transcriptional regulator YbjK
VPADDRRQAIASAALELVAERGVRALTHRGIDQWMGLPEGSTSYYMRTRRALLGAMVGEIGRRAVAARAALAELERSRTPVTPDGLAALATGFVVEAVTVQRARSAAWYALSVELSADPELHSLMTNRSPLREPLLRVIGGQLARLGVREAHRRAADLVAIAEGLMFDRIAGSRRTETLEPEELRRQIADVFTAYVRGLTVPIRTTDARGPEVTTRPIPLQSRS